MYTLNINFIFFLLLFLRIFYTEGEKNPTKTYFIVKKEWLPGQHIIQLKSQFKMA